MGEKCIYQHFKRLRLINLRQDFYLLFTKKGWMNRVKVVGIKLTGVIRDGHLFNFTFLSPGIFD